MTPHLRVIKPWATFDCLECSEEFQVRWAEGDSDPECPACWRRERDAGRLEDMLASGIPPAVSKGIHGADVTYKMLEQTTGITDLKDNLREGDVAYKPDAPRSRQEENNLIKEELQLMQARATAQRETGITPTWNGAPSAANNGQQQVSPVMAQGKAAMEAARAQGAPDPLALVEAAKKASPRPRYNVLARADKSGNVISSVRRK